MSIDAFRIAILDADLADLKQRLQGTRIAAGIEGQGWSDGIEPGFLQLLLRHWTGGCDWRAQEARLNRLPQYLAQIGEHSIHFVHQPGTGPSPPSLPNW